MHVCVHQNVTVPEVDLSLIPVGNGCLCCTITSLSYTDTITTRVEVEIRCRSYLVITSILRNLIDQ